uniref:DnaJ-class molecular chaperone n=1 Tax=Chondromyces catenulatus TaxID=1653841 RepID=A0A3S7UZH4_9BACT|nr:DnaJ-class molecular chaperone [Chondromyces catenulatus]
MQARFLILFLPACIGACVRDEAPSDTEMVEPASLALSARESAADVSPTGAPMPRPYRMRLEAAVSLNASCIACHDEQAREWRGSHHQQSNIHAAYRSAFAVEPSAFCRGCHAPESDPRVEPPRAVSELGVACVTCHVTEEGTVLAAASPDRAALAAPHPVRRSIDFAQAGGCENCHEFRFPGVRGDDDGAFMQTTVREHGRSKLRGKACAECHMPLVEGRRSHRFSNVRDPEFLRESLRARAELTDEQGVRITLHQPAPGHDFPTGDLFRRIEVGCELKSRDGKVLRREVRYLGRRFEVVPGEPGRRLTRDHRVGDEPSVVELELLPPPSKPRPTLVSWWVTYQRVATIGAGTDPAEATVESEVKLHSGALPWRSN